MSGTPSPPGPELVPVKEAARFLGITDRAVRKRLAAGTLQGHSLDGRWLVYLPLPEPAEPELEPSSVRNLDRGTGPELFRQWAEEHQAALATLAAAHAETLAAKDQLIAELQAAHRATIATQEALIDELRHRAELAEADAPHTPIPAPKLRPWWRFW